jgi:hypothetical protein
MAFIDPGYQQTEWHDNFPVAQVSVVHPLPLRNTSPQYGHGIEATKNLAVLLDAYFTTSYNSHWGLGI